MYTDQDITNLVARVQQLEQQVITSRSQDIPRIGLVSRNFLTRVFSVWGLNLLASLIIGIAVSCVFVILGLILGQGIIEGITQLVQGLLGNLPVP